MSTYYVAFANLFDNDLSVEPVEAGSAKEAMCIKLEEDPNEFSDTDSVIGRAFEGDCLIAVYPGE